jgi:hypothetical protein
MGKKTGGGQIFCIREPLKTSVPGGFLASGKDSLAVILYIEAFPKLQFLGKRP